MLELMGEVDLCKVAGCIQGLLWVNLCENIETRNKCDAVWPAFQPMYISLQSYVLVWFFYFMYVVFYIKYSVENIEGSIGHG